MTTVFALTALSALITLQWGAHYLADNLVERQAVEKAKGWHQSILNLLDNGQFTFSMADVTTSDRRSLDVFIEFSESYRYALFQPDGTIFWSSHAPSIGKEEKRKYFSERVAKGLTYVKREQKKPSEIDGLTASSTATPRKVVEIYLPVMRGTEFIGAIEHYIDVTDDIEALTSRIRLIVAALSFFALLFSTTVIGQVVIHAKRQKKLLQDMHDADLKHATDASRRNEESVILSELNDWLQSSQSLDELYEMVQAFLTKLLPGCPGSIYTYSNSRDVLEGMCSWNGGTLADNMQAEDCWGLRRGRVYNFGAHKVDFVCKHKAEDTTAPYCCVPIIAHGETVGLLHLELPLSLKLETQAEQNSWTNYKKVAAAAAEQISLAIANVRLRDQLRDQSIRDPLTGLYNRRYLMEGLRREIARSSRKSEPLALLSFDVDKFKKFNDNHGHDAGDTVLRAVGEAILNEFRDEDIACRFGGEEFIVVLPGAGIVPAKARAENLREEIERKTVRYGGSNLPAVTISVGISIMPDCGMVPQELINSADRALYAAKAAGRNCVVIAETVNVDDLASRVEAPSDERAERPCEKYEHALVELDDRNAALV